MEGLSIGNLAAAIGMSRSGLYAHFGTKEELQLATVAEAERIFDTEVMQPALDARPGRGQLAAVCEAFFSYVERRVCAGGCYSAPPLVLATPIPAPKMSPRATPRPMLPTTAPMTIPATSPIPTKGPIATN